MDERTWPDSGTPPAGDAHPSGDAHHPETIAVTAGRPPADPRRADERAARAGLQLPRRSRRCAGQRVLPGRRHRRAGTPWRMLSAPSRAAPRSRSGPGWARRRRSWTWCPTGAQCGRAERFLRRGARPAGRRPGTRPVEGHHGGHHGHRGDQAGGLVGRPAVAGVADQSADRRRRPAGAVPVRPEHRRTRGGGQHLCHAPRAATARVRRGLVLHSATKFIGGHSDLLLGPGGDGGPRAGRPAFAPAGGWPEQLPGALEAFLALRGLRTLAVRLARSQESAGILAARLQGHPAVARVRYPGLPNDPGSPAGRGADGRVRRDALVRGRRGRGGRPTPSPPRYGS